MGFFRRVLAFIIALIFILTLPAMLFVFNTGRVVFNRDIMVETFSEALEDARTLPVGLHIFSTLRAAQRASEFDTPPIDEPDVVSLLQIPTYEDWKAIQTELDILTYAQPWLVTIFDGIYAWLDTDAAQPEIVLDTREFTERVSGEHGNYAVVIVYDRLPDCTLEQINDFEYRLSQVPVGVEVAYNLCEFPQPYYDDQISDYHESLDEIAANVGDEFDLMGLFGEDLPLAQTKRALKLLRIGLYAVPVTLVVLFLLLLLIITKTARQLFQWAGIALTLGSLLALVFAIAGSSILTALLLTGPLRLASVEFFGEARQVVGLLSRPILSPLMIHSAIGLGLGLLLLVVGMIMPKESMVMPEDEELDADLVSAPASKPAGSAAKKVETEAETVESPQTSKDEDAT